MEWKESGLWRKTDLLSNPGPSTDLLRDPQKGAEFLSALLPSVKQWWQKLTHRVVTRLRDNIGEAQSTVLGVQQL